MLVVLSLYPVCALLWICMYLIRRSEEILPYHARTFLRGLCYRLRRLYTFCIARKLKLSSEKPRDISRYQGLHSCDACFQSFPCEIALHTHATSGACRPTNGVYVNQLPGISREHGAPASRRYEIWKQLFPNFEQPRSPYTDMHLEIDQFAQSCIRMLRTTTVELTPQALQAVTALLRDESLRWRSKPGEPLDHGLIPTVLSGSETDETLITCNDVGDDGVKERAEGIKP